MFRHLLDLQTRDRTGFDAELCSLPSELASRVRRLFDHHRGGTDELAQRCQQMFATALPGQLGQFTLLREIGRGGMGIVAEAQRQAEGFTQRVAIKWIPAWQVDGARRQRFLFEREVVTRLRHPHIAQLVDGGEGAQGELWYAMELVEGEDLLRHCSERRLGLQARVRLLLDLCDAVAHAHRNLILHRDIKPGNVLVDRDGRLKLIDFGIAKGLDEAAEGATLDAAPMTPRYAAPEQLRGERPTTASDQWQVAALAFELLCGLPLREGDTREAPSKRALSTSTEHLQTIGLDARLLSAQLRGDLDAILRKALVEAPEQRYASVAALAADLDAWLHGGALEARRHERWHASLRFARRQRWALLGAAGAAASLALAAGLWTQGLQAEAESARRNAEVIQRLFLQTDTSVPMPSLNLAGFFDHVVNAAIAERALPGVERQRLLLTLASTAREAGSNAAAERAAVEALRLVAELGQRGQAIESEALDISARMALTNRGVEAFEQAEAWLTRSSELQARLPILDLDAILLHLNTRQLLARSRGDHQNWLELAEQAVARAEASNASDAILSYQRQLRAAALATNRRFDEAAAEAGQLLDSAESSADPELAIALPMLRGMACELGALASPELGLARCQAAFEALQASGQTESFAGAEALNNLAKAQADLGDFERALQNSIRAEAALDTVEAGDTVSIARLVIWRLRGDIQRRMGRAEDAAVQLDRTLQAAVSISGPDFPSSLALRLDLAELLDSLGRRDEALALLEPERAIHRLQPEQQARWQALIGSKPAVEPDP